MKQKTKYTNEPMGTLRIIKDFLPPPEDLILKEDNAKDTVPLSGSSLVASRSIKAKQVKGI